jgi:HD superfamily phosphohydrolase/serine/threonine protein kinase
MSGLVSANDSRDSNEEERKLREFEDLCLIFAALLSDGDLVSKNDKLYEYLTPDLKQIQTSFRGTNAAVDRIFPLRLEPGAPVRIGGSGIVIRCANAKQPTLKYALKIPRPSLFVGRTAPAKYSEAVQEYFMHAPLSHENVVRLLAPGRIEIPRRDDQPPSNFDVLLMEWIDDAKPFDSYLMENASDFRSVVGLLIQAFKALDYLHSMHLIHWDIKADNFLVNRRGTVKLTDIGNARNLDDLTRSKIAHSTRGNPPDQLKTAEDSDLGGWLTSRRMAVILPDLSWDCPWLDLWMFARELNRLFNAVPPLFEKDCHNTTMSAEEYRSRSKNFLAKLFPGSDDDAFFARNFLRLIIQRLLFPENPSAPMCYRTGDNVIQGLSRLLPEFGGAQSIPELQAIPQRVLRLPRTGNAPWTRRVSHIFNESTLQRLRKHRQLGGVLQVYPGATHMRLEHVAGVFSAASQYVRALYADRTDPFWRLSMGSREIDALLLAALLHDGGHIAFGHFIEEMRGLIDGRSHEDYAVLMLDPQHATKVRFRDPNRKSAAEDRKLVKDVILAEWGMSPGEIEPFLQYVASVLRPTVSPDACTRTESKLRPDESAQIQLEILHSIMDSAIDADKLDYLLRDAHHCGVHYADGIDVDRFFQSLTCIPILAERLVEPLYEEPDETHAQRAPVHASIGVTEKGVLPVESMLIARYQMFSCVYWHHTTRAQTVMLQFLVLAYLEGGADDSEVEERLDDLIRHFRSVDDEEALIWLKSKLRSRMGLEQGRRALFESIADGILGEDRSQLYWRAFELRYERGLGSEAANIYAGLMRTSEQIARQTNAAGYVKFSGEIRKQFAHFFVKKLGKPLNLTDGEILIDIPPSGKDQVDNVFVRKDEKINRIQELSPLADAVSAAFRYWVRKPRVFLSPSAWKKCSEASISERQVSDACFDALKSMVVAQSDLF